MTLTQKKSNFPLIWVKHLKTQQEKDHLIRILRSSTTTISRIREVLLERLQSYEAREDADDAFDSPSWAYKQAHANGAKKEIRFLLSILDFDKKRN